MWLGGSKMRRKIDLSGTMGCGAVCVAPVGAAQRVGERLFWFRHGCVSGWECCDEKADRSAVGSSIRPLFFAFY